MKKKKTETDTTVVIANKLTLTTGIFILMIIKQTKDGTNTSIYATSKASLEFNFE